MTSLTTAMKTTRGKVVAANVVVAAAVVVASQVVIPGVNNGFARSATSAAASAAASGATGSGAAAGRGLSIGADVGWTHCPGVKSRRPMPRGNHDFVVIGLDKGQPWTKNPCLGQLLWWAKGGALHRYPNRRIEFYMIAGPPNARQQRQLGGKTIAAYQKAGWGQADSALRYLASQGHRPARGTMIWIDVEENSKQPFGLSASDQKYNRAVLDGIRSRITKAGLTPGFYAPGWWWPRIVGKYDAAAGIPFWVTIGDRSIAQALTRCSQPSPNGTRPRYAQWWDPKNQYDWDLDCRTR